ncbi:MAG: hypothetical protein ACI83D_000363 [Planctomycetota bacterium]|jgi:hypothetical protein
MRNTQLIFLPWPYGLYYIHDFILLSREAWRGITDTR